METEWSKQTSKRGYCFRPHVVAQREEPKSHGGAHEARGWHLIASLDLRRPGPIAAITAQQSLPAILSQSEWMTVRSIWSDCHFLVLKSLHYLIEYCFCNSNFCDSFLTLYIVNFLCNMTNCNKLGRPHLPSNTIKIYDNCI